MTILESRDLRLVFFLTSKCCLPALLRTILPRPVTLNRFADAYTIFKHTFKLHELKPNSEKQVRERKKSDLVGFHFVALSGYNGERARARA